MGLRSSTGARIRFYECLHIVRRRRGHSPVFSRRGASPDLLQFVFPLATDEYEADKEGQDEEEEYDQAHGQRYIA